MALPNAFICKKAMWRSHESGIEHRSFHMFNGPLSTADASGQAEFVVQVFVNEPNVILRTALGVSAPWHPLQTTGRQSL